MASETQKIEIQAATGLGAWPKALLRLALVWAALFAVGFAEWRAMADQWWNIDTYSHILLIPPILV